MAFCEYEATKCQPKKIDESITFFLNRSANCESLSCLQNIFNYICKAISKQYATFKQLSCITTTS